MTTSNGGQDQILKFIANKMKASYFFVFISDENKIFSLTNYKYLKILNLFFYYLKILCQIFRLYIKSF